MPTTKQEAELIVKIIDKYITRSSATLLMHELNNAVGEKSDNDSVKQTFAMLTKLYPDNFDIGTKHNNPYFDKGWLNIMKDTNYFPFGT